MQRPFRRGTTLQRGLTIIIAINHLLTGMIQVETFFSWYTFKQSFCATVRLKHVENKVGGNQSSQKKDHWKSQDYFVEWHLTTKTSCFCTEAQ